MDFLALCQALGLALAAGTLIGAVVPAIMPAWGVAAGAAPLGVIVAVASLNSDDEAVWPAIPIGILAAGLAAILVSEIAGGAARRAAGEPAAAAQPDAGVTAILVVAAVVTAVLAVFAPPASLVGVVALGWLWSARRRRAEQKHEGLRVLR